MNVFTNFGPLSDHKNYLSNLLRMAESKGKGKTQKPSRSQFEAANEIQEMDDESMFFFDADLHNKICNERPWKEK